MGKILHQTKLLPKIKLLLYLIGITIIYLFIISLPFFITNFLFGFFYTSNVVIEELSIVIGNLLGILFVVLLCKDKIKLNKHISFSGLNIKLLISIIFLFSAGIIVYQNIFLWIVSVLNLSQNEISKLIGTSKTGDLFSNIQMVLYSISIIIIAPIAEEILFRVIFIESLLKKEFKPVSAILISSVIFCAIHFRMLYSSINCLIFAAMVGIIYFKTNNLLYCIIAHLVNNTEVIILKFFTQNNINFFIDTKNELLFSQPVFFISLILMMIGLILLVPALNKTKRSTAI